MEDKIAHIIYKNNILQPLKGFCATVEEGTTVVAAKKNFLTQATISRQIMTLEKEIGVELFERKGSRLILTETGRRFYDMVKPKIIELENLFTNFVSVNNEEERNTLRIAGHYSFLADTLPKYLKMLLSEEEFKDTKVELFNISKQEGLAMLSSSDVDIAIYPNKKMEEDLFLPKFNVEFLYKCRYVLVLHRDHPLASMDNVSVEDIAKYQYLFLDTYMSYDPRDSFKLTPSNITCKNANWEILCSFIKENLGMIFVFETFFDNYLVHDKSLVKRIADSWAIESYFTLFTRKTLGVKENLSYLLSKLREIKTR